MRREAIIPANRVTGSWPGSLAWAHLAGLSALILLAGLSGCASPGDRRIDDVGDEIPARIARIPDAVPRVEPLSKCGNAPSYVVFGKRYYTKPNSRGYVERGLASWYGAPFHGRKTSSGEIYDMHGMSAAHKTLPLPTYARVTNLENGRSVVVRINDRGPFHGPRLIDLSHTAAVKLGVVKTGTAMVEVRAIDAARPASDPGPFLAARTTVKTTLPCGCSSRADTLSPGKNTPARDERPRDRASDSQGHIGPGRGHPGEGGPPQAKPPQPSQPMAAVASRESPTGHGKPLYLQIGAFGDPKNAERLRARLTGRLLSDRIRILAPATSGTTLYKVRIGPLDSERDAERLANQLVALGMDTPQRVEN